MKIYVTRPGDQLPALAARYQLDQAQLLAANPHLQAEEQGLGLTPGLKIYIPRGRVPVPVGVTEATVGVTEATVVEPVVSVAPMPQTPVWATSALSSMVPGEGDFFASSPPAMHPSSEASPLLEAVQAASWAAEEAAGNFLPVQAAAWAEEGGATAPPPDAGGCGCAGLPPFPGPPPWVGGWLPPWSPLPPHPGFLPSPGPLWPAGVAVEEKESSSREI